MNSVAKVDNDTFGSVSSSPVSWPRCSTVAASSNAKCEESCHDAISSGRYWISIDVFAAN